MATVLCFLFCLGTLAAYIANIMDPDLGAVWSGLSDRIHNKISLGTFEYLQQK